MQFGVCGGLDLAPVARAAGYDYIEGSVAGVLKPLEPAATFASALVALKAATLPCPVVNCFIPGNMKIVGPQVDAAALDRYVATVFQRAQQAGIKIVVFGSGGARQVPEGFSRGEAQKQLVSFCCRFAPVAAAHGVTVVVEPLNRRECNILNTVGECAALVRETDDPSVRLLVDGYHWLLDSDRAADIVANGDLLAHVHVATSPGRLPPGVETCDLGPFFKALAAAGYTGRVSFEGKLPDAAAMLPPALALMRRLAALS